MAHPDHPVRAQGPHTGLPAEAEQVGRISPEVAEQALDLSCIVVVDRHVALDQPVTVVTVIGHTAIVAHSTRTAGKRAGG